MTHITTDNLADLIAAAKKAAFVAQSLYHLQGNHDAGIVGFNLRLAISRAEHDLTAEQLDALCDYAEAHGRTWKAQLNAAWQAAAAGLILQEVRNLKGPTWLEAFRPPE